MRRYPPFTQTISPFIPGYQRLPPVPRNSRHAMCGHCSTHLLATGGPGILRHHTPQPGSLTSEFLSAPKHSYLLFISPVYLDAGAALLQTDTDSDV